MGADIAVSLSATLDTKSETPPKDSPAFWSVDEPPERWDASESFKPNTWYARLLFDIERSGLLMLSGDLRDQGRVAWLEIENGTFAYEADAIRKVLTLAELHFTLALWERCMSFYKPMASPKATCATSDARCSRDTPKPFP